MIKKMKKGVAILLACLLPVVLSACDKPGRYPEVNKVSVSGSFSAMVREKLPNYVANENELHFALITLVKSEPFLVRLNSNLMEQVEVGKIYEFVLERTVLEDNTAKAYVALQTAASMTFDTVLNGFHVRIASVSEREDYGDADTGNLKTSFHHE